MLQRIKKLVVAENSAGKISERILCHPNCGVALSLRIVKRMVPGRAAAASTPVPSDGTRDPFATISFYLTIDLEKQTMAYVIAEPCIGVKDTACVDACPVDCIHPRKNEEAEFVKEPQLYIDPVECIDCGACVPVCPVSAIFALDDLPKKWEEYAAINADHYKR